MSESKGRKSKHITFDPTLRVLLVEPHGLNTFYTKRERDRMRNINKYSLIANLKRRYKRLLSEIYAHHVVADIMTRLGEDVDRNYKKQSEHTHALRQGESKRFLYQYLIDKDEDRLFRNKHSKYYKGPTTTKQTK